MRSQCKECGGSSICEHGRERRYCKECGGKSICEHGRRRRYCKECGSKTFCEHGRERRRCKECGGNGICEHGRLRHKCKDCGGRNAPFRHRKRPSRVSRLETPEQRAALAPQRARKRKAMGVPEPPSYKYAFFPVVVLRTH